MAWAVCINNTFGKWAAYIVLQNIANTLSQLVFLA